MPAVNLDNDPGFPLTLSCEFSNFELCTCYDILKVIARSPKSSCSLDVLPSKLLVENINSFIESITHCINLSLFTGVFPDLYKTAHVRPLLKKPSLNNNVLQNYRPVFNLPFLSRA